jgi:protein-arginine kinase activator protein McsA
MTEASSAKKGSDGEVCYWCGTTFQPEVRRRRPVCPRCYRLLVGAGVTDEEIFGREESGKEEAGEEGGGEG